MNPIAGYLSSEPSLCIGFANPIFLGMHFVRLFSFRPAIFDERRRPFSLLFRTCFVIVTEGEVEILFEAVSQLRALNG